MAKAREVRGVDRVVVRDGETIAHLLERMGASESLRTWREQRTRKEVRATANRLANFDDANLRRSAQAAVAAGARVERALHILGDDVPEHLRYAGQLRVANKQASLDELGRLADPPLTKDAIAGRIRRLLVMADKRAQELGIPGTELKEEHSGSERPLGVSLPAAPTGAIKHMCAAVVRVCFLLQWCFTCGVLTVGLCSDNPNGDEVVQTSHTLIVFVLECNYPNV